MTAIETTNLTKTYGDLVAVDEVNLSVEPGEVYGFLGPNGAGKSTTINMLLDLTRPTAGSATVLGHDCQTASETIRERVGVLPEGFDLYDRMTGRQHLTFAIRAKDVDDDPDRVIERVGLDSADAKRRVGEYSKGMRQRLALGIALAGDPDLLVLDEPSSGLDPTGIAEVQDVVRSEAADGTAVFFSSHILGEVEAVCDRIGILSQGELVAEGTIDDLRREFTDGDTLELEVDRVPAAAQETIGAVDGVATVRVQDEVITVICAEPAAKAKAIDATQDAGATVEDLHTDDQNLQDVFATLTEGGEEDA